MSNFVICWSIWIIFWYLCFSFHLISMWRIIKNINWSYRKTICVPWVLPVIYSSKSCRRHRPRVISEPQCWCLILRRLTPCMYVLNLIPCHWFLPPARDIEWFAFGGLPLSKPSISRASQRMTYPSVSPRYRGRSISRVKRNGMESPCQNCCR